MTDRLRDFARGAGGRRLADSAVVLLLLSLIGLTDPSRAAGFVFWQDLFYHWDAYMMGPALAHTHGMALALDVYAPYGLGWPTLLSTLSGVLPLSHQNTIVLSAFFGVAYYFAVYRLLVVAASDRILALFGTLLLLWLGFFAPVFEVEAGGASNWQWPSMTFLRAPFDVFFFLALLVHARSGRPRASVVAAGFAALSLFFETDTGVMVVGTYALYWFCVKALGAGEGHVGGEESEAGTVRGTSSRLDWKPMLDLSAFLLVMGVGLVLATHGRFLTDPAGVLDGWLGGLTNAVRVSARLMTDYVAHAPGGLVLISVMLGLCLFTVGETAMWALHRRLDGRSLFLGCVGFYGAGRLVLFAWNSEPVRARFIAFSATIILVMALARYLQSRSAGDRASTDLAGRMRSFAPALLLVTTIGLLFASPTFQRYPNVWNSIRVPERPPGTYVLPDRREIWTDRAADWRIGQPLRAAIRELRALDAAGESVVVLDERKTFIYLHSGMRPWTGDVAHFMNTWTLDAQRDLIDRVERAAPRYVLMQRFPPQKELIRDSWLALRKSLHPRYRLAKRLPFFDLLECQTCRDAR